MLNAASRQLPGPTCSSTMASARPRGTTRLRDASGPQSHVCGQPGVNQANGQQRKEQGPVEPRAHQSPGQVQVGFVILAHVGPLVGPDAVGGDLGSVPPIG